MSYINTQSICLNMIVKNEAHIIEKTLTKLLEYFKFSYWVISDTGSTDNTIEIINSFFKSKNIPGELVEEQWKDFGYNRSFALEKAFNKSDYLLIFDADDSIEGDLTLPAQLTMDMYMLKFGPGFFYWRPLLVNNRVKWCFKGVVHEFLTSKENIHTSNQNLEGNYHIVSGRSGDRNKQGNKYLRDAQLLEEALKTEKDQGMINRYWFYTAQSYKDAGQVDQAIPYYLKVIEGNCWNQEQYISCMYLGNIYKNHKNDEINAIKYYLMTDQFDSERIEGLTTACEMFYNQKNHYLVNQIYNDFISKKKISMDSKLFVDSTLYNDQIIFFNSISSYYLNNKELAYNLTKKVLLSEKQNLNYKAASVVNLQYSIDWLGKDSNENKMGLFNEINKFFQEKEKIGNISDEDVKAWNIVMEMIKPLLCKYNKFKCKNSDTPEIILTFTTCKRINLFKQTINSILNTWLDIKKVEYWFCVDDNSSEEDREEMITLYPWIDYYMKSEEEKGHRQSMNIIWNKLKELKPKYWIHMEDDFLFFDKTNYICKALNGLRLLEKFNVKQILFNRGYGEIISDYRIKSFEKISKDYCIHVFDKNKQANYLNCYYWPHYSFRPSLVEVDCVLALGNFDSPNQFFEIDYANKYETAGYKSGFFNKISCIHIGRLTTEKNNKNIDNAYSLNNTNQFGDPSINKFPNEDLELLDKYFDFVPNLDQIGDDYVFNSNLSECIKICLQNSSLKGFNSLGFIKKKIDNLQTSAYFKENDGIYIRKKLNKIENKQLSIPIKIVNLLNRPDRKANITEQLDNLQIDSTSYEFIEAINGKEIQGTKEIYEMFRGNDFAYRKGIIGCALSHIKIWKQLTLDETNDGYIILEDDCSFRHDFVEQINNQSEQIKNEDLVFFGYHYYKHLSDIVEKSYLNYKDIRINSLNKNLYVGATHAYYISKKGAQKLLLHVKEKGLQHGIDYEMCNSNYIEPMESIPFIAFAEWHQCGLKAIDSDIQACTESFDFNFSSDNSITIGFHDNSLSERGTTRSVFNYAFYNQTILGNQSIIFYEKHNPNNNKDVIEKIGSKIKIIGYEKWEEVDTFIKNLGCKYLFLEKSGTNDGKLSKVAENIIHCVFDTSDKHGEYYTTLHKSIDTKYKDLIELPYICCPLPESTDNFRGKYNIPTDAIVFGRHGGFHTFNIPYVKETIITFAKNNPSKYFIFLNTENFLPFELKNIIFIDCATDDLFISKFINTCNAMMWGRIDGETFGLAIAEFSMKNKPIIATKCFELKERYNCNFGPFFSHVDLLGDNALWYNNEDSLYKILENFNPEDYYNKNLNFYENFTPEKVMMSFKSLISNLIKKDVSKINVKMICNWTSNDELIKEFCKMNGNKRDYENILLTEDDNADYYVIINKPKDEIEEYIPEKTIIFQMEPWIYDNNPCWGVKSWQEWSVPDSNKFLKVYSHKTELNNVQWNMIIPLIYDQTRFDKCISVLSYKYFDVGHKYRVDLLKYCDEKKSQYIDVFGYQNFHNLNSYVSPLKEDKKEIHYPQYKYCLSIENNFEHNYATEKIWEAILCECLPFYWGCPNLEDYIHPEAFVRIDISKPEEAFKIIETAIKEDWWSKRLNIIRQEKEKIINKLGFFPRLYNFISQQESKKKEFPTFLISLDKRQDRRDLFDNWFKHPYKIFNGIDGSNLKSYYTDPSFKLLLDKLNNTEIIEGEIGCKFSHFKIWESISETSIILEDDLINSQNYLDKLKNLKNEINNINSDWDIIYIGGQWTPDYSINSTSYIETQKISDENKDIYFKNTTEHLYLRINNENNNKRNSQNPLFRTSHGMVLSKKGANKLKNFALNDERFLDFPLDVFIQCMELEHQLVTYDFFPHIFYSPVDSESNQDAFKQSDIKRNKKTKFILEN